MCRREGCTKSRPFAEFLFRFTRNFSGASRSLFVLAGLRLNNAWASGTVLRPFLQPESPLSSRSLVSGFKCKLRDSNSRPPYSRPRALTTMLYTIHSEASQQDDVINFHADNEVKKFLKENIFSILPHFSMDMSCNMYFQTAHAYALVECK